MRFDNIGGGGNWLNKEELQKGEAVKLMDAGRQIESDRYKDKNGNPKKRSIFTVWSKGEKSNIELNWTSIGFICEKYGADTEDWVGKWLSVDPVFDPSKRKTFYYFHPVDDAKNKEYDEKVYKADEIKKDDAEKEGIKPEDVEW